MARKGSYDYYNKFVCLVDYSCRAAVNLHNTLSEFEADKVTEMIDIMHEIEHSADIEKHEMMERLATEFITPIEREDIIELAQEIDDVTDTIEDVLIRIYMFNIKTIRKEALEFTDIIVKCCDALKDALMELHNFHKSKKIHDGIIEVNRLEEVGDKKYIDATRNLFTSSKDTVEIISWRETFDRLEKCCDACEHVANLIESIIMKNS